MPDRTDQTTQAVEAGNAKPQRKRHRSKRIGRPPIEPTPELMDGLVQRRREGLSFKLCAELNGISASLFTEWRTRGKAGEEPFAALLGRLARARAEKGAELHGIVDSDARNPESKTSASSARWLLERRYHEDYGTKQKVAVEHTGQVDQVIRLGGTVADRAEAADGVLAKCRDLAAKANPDTDTDTDTDTDQT